MAGAGPVDALTGAGTEATDGGAGAPARAGTAPTSLACAIPTLASGPTDTAPTAPADAGCMAPSAGGASAPAEEVPFTIAGADSSRKRRRTRECTRSWLYARAVACNLTPTDRLCS